MTAEPVRTRLNLGLLQTLATFALVVFILSAARVVIIPVALAVLFVFILSPLVRLVERTGLPRTPAVLLTLLLTGAGMAGLGYVIGGQMTALARELPGKKDKIKKKIDQLRGSGGPISELMAMIDELARGDEGRARDDKSAVKEDAQKKQQAEQHAAQPEAPDVTVKVKPAAGGGFPGGGREVVIAKDEKSGLESLAASVQPVIEPIVHTALVGILVVFMLVQREDLRNRVISLFGRGQVTGTTRVLTDAAERVSKFLLFQLIVNASFGLILAVGLMVIGVNYAVLWGFLAACLRFIPYIGTWLSATFPLLLSFATSDGWAQPLTVFGFFAVLDLITANVVEPLLFGHQTGVSPVALLLAAAFWAWLWGPIGLLLAVPITVCLAVIGQHVPHLRPLALLLGDKPALPTYVAFYQRLLAKDQTEAATLAQPAEKGVTWASPALASYDAVVVPALMLARKDRETDAITADEETAMFDTTAAIVTAAAVPPKPAAATPEAAAEAEAAQTALVALPVVVGVPAHHRVEELPLMMLAAGLPPMGQRMVALTAHQLPVEAEQAVDEYKALAVVVSIVPPGGMPQAVYLINRLRQKYPKLAIVAAYFGKARSFDELLVKLRKAGATYVTTSLVQTADTVKAVAADQKGERGAVRSPPPLWGRG